MASSRVARGGDTEVSEPELNRETELQSEELVIDEDSVISPTLTVVLPTMNEEAGISTCMEWIHAAVAELQVPTEIIVSDSSTDRTPEIAREYGAIVVEPDEPGYGYAYRYAFERARGEYIAMGDADTTYDFRELPRFLQQLTETDADIVMGNRLDGEIKDGAMPPLHRYIGNPLLTGFLNTFYGVGVSDAHSGFRVFEQDALETMDLATTGMEFASEMVMEAGAHDLTIEEVPIVYHEREGEETLDSFRDGWRHVRFMLLNAPGYLFSGPGVALMVFGLTVLALASTGISIGSATLGVNSAIAGSLFIIVGYQAMSMGVFATVGGEPIQQPSDPLTTLIRDELTLERGATAGLVVFVGGVGYAGYLLLDWVTNGFMSMSFTIGALGAFTAIVLGLQTIFGAFFMSVIGQRT